MERSNNGGKDGVSYPQIANAVYISNRRNAAYYSALCARIQSKDSSGVGGAASSQGCNSSLL